MEEKRLDELMNEEMNVSEEELKKTEKLISQKMNRRIFGKSLSVSVTVVVSAVCLILGMFKYHDYVQEKNAFHLSDWEMVVEVDEFFQMENERLEVINAYAYINAYVSLFCPGFITTKDQVKTFEPNRLDYGTYEIEAELIHLFDVTAADANITNVDSEQTMIPVSWSNIWIEDTNKYDLIETRYQSYRQKGYSLGANSITEEDMEEMKQELNKLPETSIVMLDVVLNKAVTLDELLDYQHNHIDSRVVYVTTHYGNWMDGEEGDYEFNDPYGFNLNEGRNIIQVNDEYEELYPSLTLSSGEIWATTSKANFWHSLPEYNEEILTEHYLSCMKLLVNNDAAKWYEDDLMKVISDVEENGVSVKGFRIYAAKDTALELFEDENVKSVVIQNVKFSKYQK